MENNKLLAYLGGHYSAKHSIIQTKDMSIVITNCFLKFSPSKYCPLVDVFLYNIVLAIQIRVSHMNCFRKQKYFNGAFHPFFFNHQCCTKYCCLRNRKDSKI